MELTFHEDPGHGWLAVPNPEPELLEAVSGFSYVGKDGTLYAEEDCDAQTALAHLTKKGYVFVRTQHTNSDSLIRNMRRHTPRADWQEKAKRMAQHLNPSLVQWH